MCCMLNKNYGKDVSTSLLVYIYVACICSLGEIQYLLQWFSNVFGFSFCNGGKLCLEVCVRKLCAVPCSWGASNCFRAGTANV